MNNLRIVKLVMALVLAIPVLGQGIDPRQKASTDSEFSRYCQSVESIEGYKKLTKLANQAMRNGQYDKSSYAFETMIRKYLKKMSKDDVLSYYFSLMREGREKEIPHADLSGFNHFPEVEKIIEISRMKEINTQGTDMERVPVKLDLVSRYGVRYRNDSIHYAIGGENDQEYLLCSSAFRNGKIEAHNVVNDTIASAVSILSQYEVSGKGKIYNIIPHNRLPDRIITRGRGLPNFPHNSRSYSCSMPFYDEANQRLYFCSDMPGGYGGWDIYYCDLEKGDWGEPVLMGEQVNTVFDELFPSISKSTLLFSSDGHKKGKGGFDNYAYVFDQKPSYNLSNFNTAHDDYSLNFLKNKKDNVFAVCISNDSLVYYQPIAVVRGSVKKLANGLEAPDHLKMTADLAWEELASLDEVGEGAVFFDFDRSVIKKEFYPYLDHCMDSIKEKRDGLSLLIFAGADPVGDFNYNYQLSFLRAKRIKQYLEQLDKQSRVKDFIPIVLGEGVNTGSVKAPEKRLAFVKGTFYQFPYPLILAVPKKYYDSLGELAEIYNNTEAELEMINNILQGQFEDLYFVGIKGFHRARKGENMYRISLRYGIQVEELMRTNFKNSDQIEAKEILVIPVKRNGMNDENLQDQHIPSHNVGSKSFHRVKKGENMYRISRRYGIKVEELMRANLKNSYHIEAKEILVIPVKKTE